MTLKKAKTRRLSARKIENQPEKSNSNFTDDSMLDDSVEEEKNVWLKEDLNPKNNMKTEKTNRKETLKGLAIQLDVNITFEGQFLVFISFNDYFVD